MFSRKDRQPTPPDLSIAVERLKHSLKSNSQLTYHDVFERVTTSGEISKSPRAVFTPKEREVLVSSVIGDLRPGVYLEVGIGALFRSMDRVHTQESPLIAVDGVFQGNDIGGWGTITGLRDEQQAASYTTLLREKNNNNPNLSVVKGDGRHLDLPDGSVQEVFMGNVLLSPSLNAKTIEELLREARRVLNSERGILIIGEQEIFTEVREKFGTLGIILERLGFKSILVNDNIDQLSDTLGWPEESLDRIGTSFIVAQIQ